MNKLDEIKNILVTYEFVIKVILFGSRSKNVERDNSDYDLCIIIRNDTDKSAIINSMGKYMIKNNIIIHPYIFTEDEYFLKKNIDTYNINIFRDGIVLIDKSEIN